MRKTATTTEKENDMYHAHPLIPAFPDAFYRIAEPVCPGDFFDSGFGKLRQVTEVLDRCPDAGHAPFYRRVESVPLTDARRIEIADGLEKIASDFASDAEFAERTRAEAAIVRPRSEA